MKILSKGKNRLRLVDNKTKKVRNIEVRDGRDTIVLSGILPPYTTYRIDMVFQRDVRISGKGSRDAYFDGLSIRWDE
jgi:hypothetical protein